MIFEYLDYLVARYSNVDNSRMYKLKKRSSQILTAMRKSWFLLLRGEGSTLKGLMPMTAKSN